jgi:hypothetical protein
MANPIKIAFRKTSVLMRASLPIYASLLHRRSKGFDKQRQRIEAKCAQALNGMLRPQGEDMLNEFKKNGLDIATATIVAVVGLAVLSDVGPAFLSRVAFMARTVPGAGIVDRCESRQVTRFQVEFTPVAQFTAGDGRPYEARGEGSSASCVDMAYYSQPVEVRYNPASPADAMIGSTTQLLGRLTLFTMAGAVALGVGVVLAVQIWRNWPRRRTRPAT